MSSDEGDTPVQTLALRPGALIGARFRVLRSLEFSSAYAQTYLAYDEQRHDQVALKEFFPRGLARREAEIVRPHTDGDAREFARAAKRFLREGEALADISHPALPRVRGAFEANGTAYLAIDHYDAIPLPQHLALAPDGRLTGARAVELVVPLLDALELLHAEGVLHRDISPQVIFLDAARGSHPLLLSWPAHRHLGGPGIRQLAPGFAALEQYGNRGLGPWTDVHACAAILYYLVTGVTPPSAVDRAAAHTLTAPATIVSSVPAALSAAILRGMSQVPEQRPHGVAELRRLIVAPAAAQPLGSVAPPTPTFRELLAAERFTAAPDDASQRPFDLTDVTATLKLAAGVVVPEERRVVDRVRDWFAALRPAPREFTELTDAVPAPAPTRVDDPAVLPRRQVLDELAAAEVAGAGALVPAETAATPALDVEPERALPAPLDAIADESLALASIDAGAASSRRLPRLDFLRGRTPRRTRAAATVLAIGALGVIAAGAAYAYRGQTRAEGSPPSAGATTPPATVLPAAAAVLPNAPTLVVATKDSAPPRKLFEAGGSVQQGSARGETERPSASARRSEPAPERDEIAFRAPRTVELPIAQPVTSALVPAEVDADLRGRLAAGRELVEGGQYAAARRSFRSGIDRIDSLAPRYPGSSGLRTMREDFERESRRALDACNAENDLRTKRGGKALPCA